MKKRLIALLGVAAVAIATVPVGSSAATASTLGTTAAPGAIINGCVADTDTCYVYEDMGNGYCEADLQRTDANENPTDLGNFAVAAYYDEDTGYACDFWIERNVNNSGWYQLTSTEMVPSSGTATSPNIWDTGNYQAETCFQFNWGSSLGAVHCSPAM